MAPLTGYSTNFLTQALLDTGILYLNDTTPFAASAGDLAFDPGDEWQNIAEDVDGVLQKVVGADRRIGGQPKFTGTIWELVDTKMDELIPDMTASGTDPRLITPPAIGSLLPSNKYLTKVRGIWQLAGGSLKYMVVKFPNALLTKYDIKSQRKGHVQVSLEIEARAADASGAALYTIDFRSTIGGPD